MKIFEHANYNVLPISDFKLFSDMSGWHFPDAQSEHGKELIALADEALEMEIPQLYASNYRRFNIDGNRRCYEYDYFKRRTMLKKLLVGELVQNDGKYMDKIIDLVWLILEETTWITPPHNNDLSGREDAPNHSLGADYEGKVKYVDLFSAETGSLLSFVHHFLKDKLDEATPIIDERLIFEVRRRNIQPYLDYYNFWWMGFNPGRKPNNWNPWITSNVLTATALTESNISVRKRMLDKALECLDNFINGYNEDGGCNEGPGYWGHAGGALFMALEIIYDMTGGKADYFKEPIVYNMLDYIRKVHMQGFYYTNFADCPAELYTGGMVNVIRMGIRTGNKLLADFALSNTVQGAVVTNYSLVYRDLKDICFEFPERAEFIPNKFDVLKNLQVAVYRNKDGFTVAAKGGHNKESHNHNDVGQFILLNEGKPVIIDIGAPTYTKDVFSANRYKVFPINGTWHSVPVINGYGEKEGVEYVCNSFSATEEKTVIEYQGAYEKEAGVKKVLREIIPGKDVVTINEIIDFEGSEAVFQYYMADAPVKTEGNTYTFANGVKITAPGDSEIVPVPVLDEEVKTRWGTDTLYKMVVKMSKSGSFSLRFER